MGRCAATRADLAGLGAGDVWLSLDGFWIAPDHAGRGILAAPGAAFGLGVELRSDGGIVFRGDSVAVAADIHVMTEDTETRPNQLAEQVLAAPRVVRIESVLARSDAR